MLVLSRAAGEIIAIGDDITVHVLELNGNQVKFGVVAPVGVRVHRAEVYQKILKRQTPQSQTATNP